MALLVLERLFFIEITLSNKFPGLHLKQNLIKSSPSNKLNLYALSALRYFPPCWREQLETLLICTASKCKHTFSQKHSPTYTHNYTYRASSSPFHGRLYTIRIGFGRCFTCEKLLTKSSDLESDKINSKSVGVRNACVEGKLSGRSKTTCRDKMLIFFNSTF